MEGRRRAREPTWRGLVDAGRRAAPAAIDLLCSNAGIFDAAASEEIARRGLAARTLGVNCLMAHVYAARATPAMLARGAGYLLHTVSRRAADAQFGSANLRRVSNALVACSPSGSR